MQNILDCYWDKKEHDEAADGDPERVLQVVLKSGRNAGVNVRATKSSTLKIKIALS